MTAGPSVGPASSYPIFRTPALICFSKPKDVFVPLLIILFTFLNKTSRCTMTVQRREQAHFLTYIFLLVVCVQLCEKNDDTAQTDSANRTKSYAIKSNALQRSRGEQPIQGVPGDAVPWPEREVSLLPSLFPRLRRQAAQESHPSSYERRPASAFYSSKNRSVDIAPLLSITSAIILSNAIC